jgi:hypothetical protein
VLVCPASVALVLAMNPACTGNNCFMPVERSITVSLPADTALEFAIETCHVDADACVDLCAAALKRLRENVIPDSCEATFYATEVDLDVKYKVGGDACNDAPVTAQPHRGARADNEITDSPEPRMIELGLSYGPTG